MLSMIVYANFPKAVDKRPDACIIAVNQDTRLLFFQYVRQELLWPECLGFVARPRQMRISIQSVYEHDVYLRITNRRVYL